MIGDGHDDDGDATLAGFLNQLNKLPPATVTHDGAEESRGGVAWALGWQLLGVGVPGATTAGAPSKRVEG